ncbi:MAG: hypothetical protein E6Q55_09575, partial [Mycolicibacterium mageritense]
MCDVVVIWAAYGFACSFCFLFVAGVFLFTLASQNGGQSRTSCGVRRLSGWCGVAPYSQKGGRPCWSQVFQVCSQAWGSMLGRLVTERLVRLGAVRTGRVSERFLRSSM